VLGNGTILLASLGYLGVLFAIAWVGDRWAGTGRSLIANPYVYTLSIAVYCTAWTFYGSVGRAAETGVGFLPIYLGPTLSAMLGWFVLRKIVRISRIYRITSIADFIASRYGKSTALGGLVTIVAVIGILPYISLQLKAVSTSYTVLRHYPDLDRLAGGRVPAVWEDTALFVALLLAAFTIIFGTRNIDVTERHEGMVAAIAFESLFKLLAFLAVGGFVTYGLFDGAGALFTQALADPLLVNRMQMGSVPGGYTGWFALTLASMFAVMFLPRQFHVAVVENVDEDHVRKAAWLFPLYLFAINLFVLPLAFGGALLFPDGSVDPDTYVLTLPMAEGQLGLALFVFLGGLSAATGMVIVATIALSTMVSNDLVVPVLLRMRGRPFEGKLDPARLLIGIRRATIVLVLLLGYLYFRYIGESYALVTIGLVSFCAAAQFAPAVLLGLYWKGASRIGAIAGLSGGFLVWLYTLLIPGFARSGWLPVQFLEEGPFGLASLHPYRLFGLEGFDPISHSLFWSLLVNTALLVGLSLYRTLSLVERIQAERFVDVYGDGAARLDTPIWHGAATVEELQMLVGRFLGEDRVRIEFDAWSVARGRTLGPHDRADQSVVGFAEQLLAGAIGAASARVMIGALAGGDVPSLEDVMDILDETSQVRSYSRRLEQKSRELETATAELRAANTRLQELDRLKDEFVATVSHELRTPLTSIRAFSEILLNNRDMEVAQREEFLQIVVKESERLTRLINEVLDLAKIESGRMDWHVEELDLRELVDDALAAVSQLLREREIELERDLPSTPMIARVDRDRIVQLLINLLSNAAKFCNTASGRIVLRLDERTKDYRLEVEDNGSGIAPEHAERIFEKFQQIEDDSVGKPAGTGLGLAISRRIAEHHGGRLHIEHSEPGCTVFAFELPRPDQTRSGPVAAGGSPGNESSGERTRDSGNHIERYGE